MAPIAAPALGSRSAATSRRTPRATIGPSFSTPQRVAPLVLRIVSCGRAVEEDVVVPDVGERVDVGADVGRQHDRVLGELEAVGAAGARRVVAAVAVHEAQHAVAVGRDRGLRPERHAELDDLAARRQTGTRR